MNLCGPYIPKYSFLKQYLIFVFKTFCILRNLVFYTGQFSTNRNVVAHIKSLPTTLQCSDIYKSDKQDKN